MVRQAHNMETASETRMDLVDSAIRPTAGNPSRFELLFESNPSPVMVINRETLQFLAVNDAALAFYGYDREEFLALRLPDIRPEQIQGEIQGMIERFSDPTLPDVPRLHVTKGGERRIVRVSARVFDYDGVSAILATIFDMTRQQRMEEEVHRARQFLKTIVDRVPSALYVKDAETGQYILYNPAAERMFGRVRDSMIGRTAAQLFSPDEAARIAEQDEAVMHAGPEGISSEGSFRVGDGSHRHVRIKKVVIGDSEPGERRYILAVAEDITEERQREERIAHMASHDELTGLANRWLLQQRLEEARRDAAGAGGMIAIHYIDMDGFKGVNDSRGHAAGDALLKAVAVRMLETVRRTDLVARLGGDEFAVLQHPVQGEQEVAVLAGRLVERLSLPYLIESGESVVSASIGVALARGGQPVDQLIDEADQALYAAKRAGRNRFVIAGPAMEHDILP